jgi:hypothetical protein
VAEFNILGFLTERIGELIRDYNTVLMNGRGGAGLLDELSRLSVLRNEVKNVAHTKQQAKNRLVMPPAKFSTIDAVYRRMDGLARDVAATPRGDPRRLKMIEEMARLGILAESVKKNGDE